MLILAVCHDAARGAEKLSLLLQDGRFVSGELDAATDHERLWLNASEVGVALRSGFEWAKVVTVVHDSKQHSAAEFRKLVSQLPGSTLAAFEDLDPTHRVIDEAISATGPVETVVPVAYAPSELPRVRSLRVRAWTASWDDDPELDGLLVEVTPLGQYGEFVAVDAQLSMTLIGEHSQGHPEQLRRFRPRYPEIARQSEQVRLEHFFLGPAVYKLPYRNLIPEERLDLFPQGVLTATLGVPGQGNFTASTDAVSLIPASPIRDRRQQDFGRRYFPQELSRLR